MTFPKLCLGLLVPALCAGLAGCNSAASISATPPPAVGQVDSILVQTLPAAVNWDGQPGPDGLEARVYLFQYDRKLPVAAKGTLEFTVYEGILRAEGIAEAKPFYSWRFDGETLKEHLTRSAVGWGYTVRLGWGAAAPAASAVTLLSRYLPPEGRPIVARPITLATGPR